MRYGLRFGPLLRSHAAPGCNCGSALPGMNGRIGSQAHSSAHSSCMESQDVVRVVTDMGVLKPGSCSCGLDELTETKDRFLCTQHDERRHSICLSC